MDLDSRYPGLADLKRRAQQRLPKFVWEYLDSGTGSEATKALNRVRLDAIGMMPSILHGEFTPDLTTEFLGQTLSAPFGIAPVGMSGLIWPDAEGHLARSAAKNPWRMRAAPRKNMPSTRQLNHRLDMKSHAA